MRMIFMLLALAIVGVMAAKQLQREPAAPSRAMADPAAAAAPAVPVRPQDLQRFGQDMNRFVEDTARERQRRLEEGDAR